MSLTIERLEQFGENFIGELLARMLSENAVATGETYDSVTMRTEVTPSTEKLIIEGGRAFGVNQRGNTFLEDGRGEGGLPPFERIANWAIARGIIQDIDEDAGIIFAIRRKIAESGTKNWRENKFRDIAKSLTTEERIESLIADLTDDFFFEVSSKVYKLKTT
jgi:hypothetical protein